MKKFLSKFSNKKGVLSVFIIGLLLFVFISNVRGETPLDGILKRVFPKGDVVIAWVNGEPVDLNSLETMKSIVLTNQPLLSDPQAYQEAMQLLIRDKVLADEAKNRGIQVSKEEAEAYWEQMQTYASQSPEISAMLKKQEESFSGSKAQLEKKIITLYQESLAVQKLTEQVFLEAPQPTEEEIRLELVNNPVLNQLVLIPMEFSDAEEAQTVFKELEELKSYQSVSAFEETFTSYVQKQTNPQPGYFLHKEFFYQEIGELLDYAQSAVDIPENSIEIYERDDRTAVIYLVLQSVRWTEEQAQEQVRDLLWQEKQSAYLLAFEDDLIKNAKVEYIPEELPEEARLALTGK